jgi:small subunit ribosomal protein S1
MSNTVPSAETHPAFEENFDELFAASIAATEKREGTVVVGKVIALENDAAVIDVGLKAEGRVPFKEFIAHGHGSEPAVGDEVEVFLDRIENRNGEAVLSRDRARREQAWAELEEAFEAKTQVTGIIWGRVKGGYTVDLQGASAFLPRSQVDLRPVRDAQHLFGTKQPFYILKMDRRRGNIVISRRAVLEETRAEARAELVATLKEGQILDGVVKNITEYGAFVELEPGIEGLVHVSEMSWTRKNVPPSKLVSTSEEVEVMILGVDPNRRRVSLGMRQCAGNPWEKFADEHPVGSVIEGEVRNITEFGVFLGMPGDIDGLIHLSDLDASRPGEEAIKEFRKGDRVRAKVLEIDVEKERINLSTRQLEEEKVAGALAPYSRGQVVTCVVTEVTDSGLRVTVDEVNGFIRRSDLSKLRTDQNPHRFAVGERVDAKVVSIDTKAARLVLSIKSLEIEEEQRVLREYGSSESGASLGDILSEALKPKEE